MTELFLLTTPDMPFRFLLCYFIGIPFNYGPMFRYLQSNFKTGTHQDLWILTNNKPHLGIPPDGRQALTPTNYIKAQIGTLTDLAFGTGLESRHSFDASILKVAGKQLASWTVCRPGAGRRFFY